MLELAEKIGIYKNTLEELEKLFFEEGEAVERCCEKCLDKGFHCLKRRSPLFCLAVILSLAVRAGEKYISLGIGEKIYYDTMSDIKIWYDKTGGRGIKNYGWLKNHVKAELFRLGRLQFQLYESKNRALRYDKLPFNLGDKVIYVHIPEGEPLKKEECERSFELAREFFSTYFPSFDYKCFFCESWLLFEGNRAFMAKDSNIVAFMSLFEIVTSVKIELQAIERIFGKRHLIKKNYPENTSLQKRAKAYMLDGNRLGVGIGFRKR